MKVINVENIKKLKNNFVLKKDKIQQLKSNNHINNESDVYGDGNPTLLFPFLI